MKEVGVDESFDKQDIKTDPVTEEQIEELKAGTGSYEKLFNRRARKYQSLGLKDEQLGENDYKNYLLEDYTFLKRPVFNLDNEIFVGNSKNVVEAVKNKLKR